MPFFRWRLRASRLRASRAMPSFDACAMEVLRHIVSFCVMSELGRHNAIGNAGRRHNLAWRYHVLRLRAPPAMPSLAAFPKKVLRNIVSFCVSCNFARHNAIGNAGRRLNLAWRHRDREFLKQVLSPPGNAGLSQLDVLDTRDTLNLD